MVPPVTVVNSCCAVLDGFVRPDAVAEMVMESKALRAQTTAIDRPWVASIPDGETRPEAHPHVHRATRGGNSWERQVRPLSHLVYNLMEPS
jgi:hypothetical protein